MGRSRNEWWYWTGNLEGPGARRFGYQFTIFRSSLAPESDAGRGSAWATTQIYMAHFALTDVASGKFYSFERTSRGALDLAGASASPFRVWVLDWSVAAKDGASAFPARVAARNESVAIDLQFEQGKPVVLHGEGGLSPKGSQPGNASYYYSLTRMPTTGTVAVDGARWDVRGESWMDREWSTSALEPDQVGWDWLALQLEDGREVMVFRLRRKDGSDDPMSAGSVVDRDGASRRIGALDFSLRAIGTWTSPRSGASYPCPMELRIPSADLDLRIEPLAADQELDVSFRYWEGAVRAVSAGSAHAVTARGYLELTGYGESPPGAR